MTEPDLTFFRALEQQYQETMTRPAPAAIS